MAADQPDSANPENPAATASDPAAVPPAPENTHSNENAPEPDAKNADLTPKKISPAQSIIELFQTLRSPDRPSRKMASLFVLSLGGLLTVIVQTVQTIREDQVTRQTQDKQARAVTSSHDSTTPDTPANTVQQKNALVEAGSFQIEVKPAPGAPPTTQTTDVATIEIVLLCDSAETARTLHHDLPKVRNLLLNIFISIDREQLMSNLGKKTLKNNIRNKINGWLTKGQIQDVFFAKLILN